jgi:glutaredoxin
VGNMSEVIIYTSPTCGYCTIAKKFLNENGVSYIEKDVTFDSSASGELEKLGARGVPVITYGTEVIMGFDKQKLEALFGKLIIECPECRSKLRLPKNKGTLEVTCKSCGELFRVNSNRT